MTAMCYVVHNKYVILFFSSFVGTYYLHPLWKLICVDFFLWFLDMLRKIAQYPLFFHIYEKYNLEALLNDHCWIEIYLRPYIILLGISSFQYAGCSLPVSHASLAREKSGNHAALIHLRYKRSYLLL